MKTSSFSLVVCLKETHCRHTIEESMRDRRYFLMSNSFCFFQHTEEVLKILMTFIA
jgi:hypothetical protein